MPNVSEPSLAYKEMAQRWSLIHDLLGGTPRMREAGKTRLPMEPREAALAYENRLERSYLYGALSDTIDKVVSKPFSRPVMTSEELPDALRSVADDPSLQGLNLTQFSRELFADAVTHGLSHVLVDYPRVGEGLSLAEERQAAVRPYFVRISPPDLIGWSSERRVGGREELTEVRIRESRVEARGDYTEEVVERVRVITADTWQTWQREGGKDSWVLMEEGTHTFGAVPLVTLYLEPTGFMTATPPFEDLAWLNLAHWQSLSDQRNILRFARMPLLYQFGISEEEMDGELTIGPAQLLRSTNPDAKMGYVEHSGHAIEAGDRDLRNLEAQMEVLGLQPLIQKTGGATATGRALDESRMHSNIHAWVRALENVLLEAFISAGEWMGLEIPDEFSVDVFSDFGLTLKAEQDVRALLDMRNAGLLTHRTFLEEVKRRGLLSDSVDLEAEVALTEDEGVGLG
tara:strand:- start:822 stop:2195 length:1374 start_codon:yes stop_codon:yes gene_type:complete